MRGYLFKFVAQKSVKMEVTKVALTAAAWALGASRVLPVYYQAPVAHAGGAGSKLMPVVIFSHGLAGTRNAYSSICIDLASRGYVVMALEHSDGSASVARLPRPPPDLPAAAAATAAASSAGPASQGGLGGAGDKVAQTAAATEADGAASTAAAAGSRGGRAVDGTTPDDGGGGAGRVYGSRHGSEWRFYGGLGDKMEQLRKTRHRVAEVEAAYQLLASLHEGRATGVQELPAGWAEGLRGRLDLSRAAVIGHSYGGATAAAAAAQLPCFAAAVSLDPWWDCFEDSWPVLAGFSNPRGPPLLVIGSEDWNTPNAEGRMKCGGANQERALAAAAAGGGGAVLLVPRGSTHGNFDDVLLLFGKMLSGVLRFFNMRTSLEPTTAHRINMWCISHFLAKHLQPAATSAKGVGLAAAAGTGGSGCCGSRGGSGAGPNAGGNESPAGPAAAVAGDDDRAGQAGPSASGEGRSDGARREDGRVMAEAQPGRAGFFVSQPLQDGDLEPYREHVGEWAAILRMMPGGAKALTRREG
ncbi:hypothetical protein GPECTOR_2g1456 [Gonium pectorale]|uniref:1-alkyl-2-acetylglycerophosphocholine esterase n=1 Tax=Gonium pectorale TaxID=33097 RepID=A0A150H1F3_GONPE|nr:hypothetical protein GPECTOR_2g1456 [Gonium pectorale]|eukprot:KXZ55905.1 hypothetical protein GPECTOR_2g1456 [Gonium pectorale]